MEMPQDIVIIGVGYVGLPLAMTFSKKFKVIAYDRNEQRVSELKSHFDRTEEVTSEALKTSSIHFTANLDDIKKSNFFIVTVPTPVDEFNVPDLEPLLASCNTLGPILTKGTTIVYESTVYPGLTEEVLAPKLEKLSGLVFNKDFFLGYSPERVNPGDKEHTIEKIKKVVSGSNEETLEKVSAVYGAVIPAGIFKAKNIATAEAAKVIENIQRDVNIGLINELTVLFERMNLSIHEVLEASSTKWNFLRFKPGLVGGHCIGVDPFYLTFKAAQLHYHPEVILAGRRVNDHMGEFYAEKLLKRLLAQQISPVGTEVLILGFTFKENCPDTRNTKVFDLIKALQKFGMKAEVVDPVADQESALHEYKIDVLKAIPEGKKYSASILAVPHKAFEPLLPNGITKFLRTDGVLLDIKGILPQSSHIFW